MLKRILVLVALSTMTLAQAQQQPMSTPRGVGSTNLPPGRAFNPTNPPPGRPFTTNSPFGTNVPPGRPFMRTNFPGTNQVVTNQIPAVTNQIRSAVTNR